MTDTTAPVGPTPPTGPLPYAYDVTGSGPVLLVMPGGAGHPMGLEPLTEWLAADFTVVTYDPLGLAHGRLGRPVPEQLVARWSDGAHRVLETVLPKGESAYVFGTSSGGVAALDLLARHPGRLAHVVAHEPPCVTLLPDGPERRAELIGQLDGPKRPPAQGESATPMGVFLAHVLRPFTAHVPAFTAPSGRLTVAVGTDSRGQLLHRTGRFLAERLGGALTEFPGGHLGALDHPAEFADLLATTLGSSTGLSV
ncbi:alpha/beta hydrolase [Streptomyces pluripotens]|uniref:Alpha/beta hydrolase n=1 Tax=Streptomyces pluripotens TaxID=1355015 RepID=A0A221P522_9ACTN|nr:MULTISPECIES: alpha/beta hydrolase [Streptomyces]ARP73001.1 alpha/beta hydrolase [Streptomyces pluripotens]ASN27252.1 alpha/beta hydrolase [Streptomyces pluripotens]MCH0557912.1 alpha/beta hydrolase [Streptomyces sp. MUM 16J]